MLYKNTITGATLETECDIRGENWEPVKAPEPRALEEEAPKKKAPKKKEKKK